MKFIPYSLLGLRLALTLALLIDSLDGKTNHWFSVGLAAALLSDIFDGMIARRLGAATKSLRVADSRVDTLLIFCVAASLWFAQRPVLLRFAVPFGWMFGLYFISLIYPKLKFGEWPSYHAYSAKLAGLAMVGAVAVLFGYGPVDILLWLAILAAILSHIDRILIAYFLPESAEDVAGAWQAWDMRQNARVSSS
jgi:CDP-diacylglycerol--glycerol-3-phosphate 3-phosphatidyltransferase